MSLQKIQTELNAPKDLYNKFGQYHYRSCESILKAVKPLLAKYEASLLISDEIIDVAGRVYVRATVSLSIDGGGVKVSACAREAEKKKGMDEAQITGAASSYARKYALNGLFAIDDTKDADATNKHGQKEVKEGANSSAYWIEKADDCPGVDELELFYKENLNTITKSLTKQEHEKLLSYLSQLKVIMKAK